MADFWESEVVLGEIDKNDRGEKIIVKKCTKGNKSFIDVRTFFLKDEVLCPGKGIAIPEDLSDEVALAILRDKGGKKDVSED